ncbi:MAG: transposase, partial [Deltaproteobacteria bacterium]|nr:transposase [Deltaproteobacteria bacterium]
DPEEQYNHLLMRQIDEQFTKTPFYGSRKMTACLKRQGHKVNRKRIRRQTALLITLLILYL